MKYVSLYSWEYQSHLWRAPQEACPCQTSARMAVQLWTSLALLLLPFALQNSLLSDTKWEWRPISWHSTRHGGSEAGEISSGRAKSRRNWSTSSAQWPGRTSPVIHEGVSDNSAHCALHTSNMAAWLRSELSLPAFIISILGDPFNTTTSWPFASSG